MKLWFVFILMLVAFVSPGCQSPEATLEEARDDLKRGLSGQGRLEERGWEDVEIYQE